MRYPARFEPASEGGYVVTFRDIPEAITQGDDDAEAMEMAEDVIVSAMDFYFEDQRQVAMPSELHDGERWVELPPSVSAKVLLLNAMLEQRVSQSELARRMKVSRQEVQRIVDLQHSTKIDTLSDAMRALGKRLEVVVA